jgi:hypothetical protein
VVAGQLTTLRSWWHTQFICASIDGEEFGRGVWAAGELGAEEKVAFTMAVTPVIAGHATNESLQESFVLRHVVCNGGGLSATRSSNRR